MSIVLARSIRHAYRLVVRPTLFRFDPEAVHTRMVRLGELLGKQAVSRVVARATLGSTNPILAQTCAGIRFRSPFGLAAGFDYEASLTGILPSLGFGFQTIGTITNGAYSGNPRPRLGRLVRSRSLMVNKGFKNAGIDAVLAKLSTRQLHGPVGLSIGQTNGPSIRTADDAVRDIVAAFRAARSSGIEFSYYELNISCPNLGKSISFSDPDRFDALLEATDALDLRTPILIKLPISVPDDTIRALVRTATKHRVHGVIIGNLQKDRTDPALDPAEVSRFPSGNFSGLPTQYRSDELIRLVHNLAGDRLLIVGCGGVFAAEDAYRKIRAGASLIQLITGLIYEGPQLIAELNDKLAVLLARDGYSSIREAVGSDRLTISASRAHRGRHPARRG
ncbi:MAG: quinone-dependent dihydroorotate dehydrogenase [Patescibacteria group bacterium]|jgi:dihydroorotate dehydrogenase